MNTEIIFTFATPPMFELEQDLLNLLIVKATFSEEEKAHNTMGTICKEMDVRSSAA